MSIGLPRWQSHKKVYGDRIKEIMRLDPLAGWGPDDTGLRWFLDCGAIVPVTKDLIARGSPTVGDYFVQYDGYKSWSSAKAFEEGYTRIGECEEGSS